LIRSLVEKGVIKKKINDGETMTVDFSDPQFPWDGCFEYISENFVDTETVAHTTVNDAEMGKQTHETSGTGNDLNAILTRLWKFIGGIASAEAKNEAINRILKGIGKFRDSDKKMDDQEFETKLAVKDAELEELKSKLTDAVEKLKIMEDKEKTRVIDSIKKFAAYEDSELEGKCLTELEIIQDAVSRFEPTATKAKVLPKGKHNDSQESRINPSEIFKKVGE
jgi:hypothetical protein